jgi:hypothetical protein
MGLAAGLGLLLVFSYLNRGHQLDDALIYARYVDNALRGNGLVYNVGERVNGLTSPLFAYLNVIASYLAAGDVQLGSTIVCTVSWGVAALAFFSVFGRKNRATAIGAAAGCFFLATSRFTYFTYGMETGLFMALCAIAMSLFSRHEYGQLGIVTALLLLTRLEGVFLVAAMAIEHLRLKRSLPNARHFLIPALIIIGQFGFSLLYYGTLLSQSAQAKLQQGASGLWTGLSFIHYGMTLYHLIFGGAYLFVPLLILGILGLFRWRSLSLSRISVVFVLLYTAFFEATGIPGQVWYYGPHFVFLWFYAGLGIVSTAEWFWQRTPFHRFGGLTVLGTVLIVAVSWSLMILPPILGNVIRDDYRRIGIWVRENTPENASIALAEIGTVGWYSERRIVDILGLITPRNAHFVGKQDFESWAEYYRPELILVHRPPRIFEKAAIKLQAEGRYQPEQDFSFSGFDLLVRK